MPATGLVQADSYPMWFEVEQEEEEEEGARRPTNFLLPRHSPPPGLRKHFPLPLAAPATCHHPGWRGMKIPSH